MRRIFSPASVFGVVVGTGLLTVFVAALIWHLQGGRWYMVQTPSMGTAAPVGTLLLTRPTSVDKLEVGDVITFRVPSSRNTYSHRIVAKTGNQLRTKGDINTIVDPWTITDADLIGKVTHRWWAFGWVLRAVPLLLICLAVVWLVAAFLPTAWRSPTHLAGAGLSVAISAAILRPWVGVVRLGTSDSTDGPVVRIVSTGILPIRVSGPRGSTSVHLVNGRVGEILIPKADGAGAYHLNASLDLSLAWWIAIVIACLAPLLWTLIVGLAPVPYPDPAGQGDADEQDEYRDSGLADSIATHAD